MKMARITRGGFIRSLEGKQVSLEKMRPDRGISSTAKNRMARADLNGDGFVKGTEEVSRLFTEMDHYDRDGNADSVNTNTADVRAIQATLMRSAESIPTNNTPSTPAPSTPSTPAPSAPSTNTALDELLTNNPGLQKNQDLINLFLRRNQNNFVAADRDAARYGLRFNDLLNDRNAPIRGGGSPTAPTAPSAPTQPVDNTPVTGIGRVAGMERTSASFRRKVVEIAGRLRMNPTHLMAVMSFETGETFSPSKRNRLTGATGLIQFMPSTARRLGTTTSELSRMSPERQLDYVERYLRPYRGKMNSLEDAYMAVLWPAAVGRGPNHVLFRRGTRAYRQNNGLDRNRNGVITAREAASKVRDKLR